MLSIKLGVLAIFLLLLSIPILKSVDVKPGGEWTVLDRTLCIIGLTCGVGSVFLATVCAIVPVEKKPDNEEELNEDFEPVEETD